MIPIVQKGDPVLREKAQTLPVEEITSPKVKAILKRMTEGLYQEEDGVAIAAPQIGESVRIFIVSGKVLSPNYPDLHQD
ncbi:MAG: peptide deformylase, peptide deformylase, partial [Candidatus Paceibacter sp.]|nr:peptide deformylase, peptide deformylase [Candidatus Paceibacter sp.]